MLATREQILVDVKPALIAEDRALADDRHLDLEHWLDGEGTDLPDVIVPFSGVLAEVVEAVRTHHPSRAEYLIEGIERLTRTRRLIAEAVAWSALRGAGGDPGALRSLLGSEPTRPTNSTRARLRDVALVVEARSKAIREARIPLRPLDLAGGRLIAHVYRWCTWDGVAIHESGGYFDEGDLPPADTWIAVVAPREPPEVGFLLSFVPAPFLDRVQDAINVQIMNDLQWIEDLEPLARQEPIFLPRWVRTLLVATTGRNVSR